MEEGPESQERKGKWAGWLLQTDPPWLGALASARVLHQSLVISHRLRPAVGAGVGDSRGVPKGAGRRGIRTLEEEDEMGPALPCT